MPTAYSSVEEFEFNTGSKLPEFYTLPKPKEINSFLDKKLLKFAELLNRFYLEESGKPEELVLSVKKTDIEATIFKPLKLNRKINLLWDLKNQIVRQLKEYETLHDLILKYENEVNSSLKNSFEKLKEIYSIGEKQEPSIKLDFNELQTMFQDLESTIEAGKKRSFKRIFTMPSMLEASNDTLIYERIKNTFLNWTPRPIYPKQWENLQSSNWETLVKNIENFYTLEKNLDEFNEYDVRYFYLITGLIFDLLAVFGVYKILYELSFGIEEIEVQDEDFEEKENEEGLPEEAVEEHNEFEEIEVERKVKYNPNSPEAKQLNEEFGKAINEKINFFIENNLMPSKQIFSLKTIQDNSGIKEIIQEFKQKNYYPDGRSSSSRITTILNSLTSAGKIRKRPDLSYEWC